MAFGRQIELAIGPAGGTGTLITDLRVEFEVTKTRAASPNKATVRIYNLSEATLQAVNQAGLHMILKAGYADEGGPSNIFFGDTVRATLQKEPPNRVLEIEAMDGYSKMAQQNFSASFAPGVSEMDVFNAIQTALGYPLAGPLPPFNGTFPRGYAFSGKAKEALTQFLKRYEVSWSVQNEQLVLSIPGETSVKTGLMLSLDSGLLRLPEKIEESAKKSGRRGNRYKLSTLLFPQLSPGAEVVVNAGDVQNVVMVLDSCEYVGDNYGGDFRIVSEAVPI